MLFMTKRIRWIVVWIAAVVFGAGLFVPQGQAAMIEGTPVSFYAWLMMQMGGAPDQVTLCVEPNRMDCLAVVSGLGD